jgi:hypothetical protein
MLLEDVQHNEQGLKTICEVPLEKDVQVTERESRYLTWAKETERIQQAKNLYNLQTSSAPNLKV